MSGVSGKKYRASPRRDKATQFRSDTGKAGENGTPQGVLRKSDEFKLGYNLWLEKDGAFFDDELSKLLLSIRASGSITQAARELNISYRAAWGCIKTVESRWGIQLVYTQAGGEMGGGSGLTSEAEKLLQKYGALKNEIDKFLKKIHVF